ncbi:MAG: VWA domain-containing protein [Verrucomicrobia bacterium]|nr:VWA domain-containing protein [Verrucomicrobiota bacterium]
MSFEIYHRDYNALYKSACNYTSNLRQQYATLDLTYNPAFLRWPQLSGFVGRLSGSYDTLKLYRQYAALNPTYTAASLRWPEVSNFARRHTLSVWNGGKVFFWTYKEWVAGGIVLALALGVAHYIWRNRPQVPKAGSPPPPASTTQNVSAAPPAVSLPPPTALAPPPEPPVATAPPPAEPQLKVKLESSLNVAVLDIEGPEKKNYAPPKASLIFCIDISGSMGSEDRLATVITALKDIVDDASRVIAASKEAKISLEIIVFDDRAEQFLDFTALTSQSAEITQLKEKISQMKSRNLTKILLGLGMACDRDRLNWASREGTPTVVLLTDGDETIVKNNLKPIHENLRAVKAKLFAIGIGRGHRKETLKTIINHQQDISTGAVGEYGEYRDASAGSHAIRGAISEIYGRAIASFSQLELRASGLQGYSWSVAGATLLREHGEVRYFLGHLNEGEKLSKALDIYGDQFPSTIDLKHVTFYLSFTKPQGVREEISLAYNPDTLINGPLLKRAKALGSTKA